MPSAMAERIGSGTVRRAAERALRAMPQAAIAAQGRMIAFAIAKHSQFAPPATVVSDFDPTPALAICWASSYPPRRG